MANQPRNDKRLQTMRDRARYQRHRLKEDLQPKEDPKDLFGAPVKIDKEDAFQNQISSVLGSYSEKTIDSLGSAAVGIIMPPATPRPPNPNEDDAPLSFPPSDQRHANGHSKTTDLKSASRNVNAHNFAPTHRSAVGATTRPEIASRKGDIKPKTESSSRAGLFDKMNRSTTYQKTNDHWDKSNKSHTERSGHVKNDSQHSSQSRQSSGSSVRSSSHSRSSSKERTSKADLFAKPNGALANGVVNLKPSRDSKRHNYPKLHIPPPSADNNEPSVETVLKEMSHIETPLSGIQTPRKEDPPSSHPFSFSALSPGHSSRGHHRVCSSSHSSQSSSNRDKMQQKLKQKDSPDCHLKDESKGREREPHPSRRRSRSQRSSEPITPESLAKDLEVSDSSSDSEDETPVTPAPQKAPTSNSSRTSATPTPQHQTSSRNSRRTPQRSQSHHRTATADNADASHSKARNAHQPTRNLSHSNSTSDESTSGSNLSSDSDSDSVSSSEEERFAQKKKETKVKRSSPRTEQKSVSSVHGPRANTSKPTGKAPPSSASTAQQQPGKSSSTPKRTKLQGTKSPDIKATEDDRTMKAPQTSGTSPKAAQGNSGNKDWSLKRFLIPQPPIPAMDDAANNGEGISELLSSPSFNNVDEMFGVLVPELIADSGLLETSDDIEKLTVAVNDSATTEMSKTSKSDSTSGKRSHSHKGRSPKGSSTTKSSKNAKGKSTAPVTGSTGSLRSPSVESYIKSPAPKTRSERTAMSNETSNAASTSTSSNKSHKRTKSASSSGSVHNSNNSGGGSGSGSRKRTSISRSESYDQASIRKRTKPSQSAASNSKHQPAEFSSPKDQQSSKSSGSPAALKTKNTCSRNSRVAARKSPKAKEQSSDSSSLSETSTESSSGSEMEIEALSTSRRKIHSVPKRDRTKAAQQISVLQKSASMPVQGSTMAVSPDKVSKSSCDSDKEINDMMKDIISPGETKALLSPMKLDSDEGEAHERNSDSSANSSDGSDSGTDNHSSDSSDCGDKDSSDKGSDNDSSGSDSAEDVDMATLPMCTQLPAQQPANLQTPPQLQAKEMKAGEHSPVNVPYPPQLPVSTVVPAVSVATSTTTPSSQPMSLMVSIPLKLVSHLIGEQTTRSGTAASIQHHQNILQSKPSLGFFPSNENDSTMTDQQGNSNEPELKRGKSSGDSGIGTLEEGEVDSDSMNNDSDSEGNSDSASQNSDKTGAQTLADSINIVSANTTGVEQAENSPVAEQEMPSKWQKNQNDLSLIMGGMQHQALPKFPKRKAGQSPARRKEDTKRSRHGEYEDHMRRSHEREHSDNHSWERKCGRRSPGGSPRRSPAGLRSPSRKQYEHERSLERDHHSNSSSSPNSSVYNEPTGSNRASERRTEYRSRYDRDRRSTHRSQIKDYDAPPEPRQLSPAPTTSSARDTTTQSKGDAWSAIINGRATGGGGGGGGRSLHLDPYEVDAGRSRSRRPVQIDSKPQGPDFYLSEARKLKHVADKLTNQHKQSYSYLKAITWFLQAGFAIEKKGELASMFDLYTETLRLLRNIQYKIPENDRKLSVLGLRIQSLLYYKLYCLKRHEMSKLRRVYDEHNKATGSSPFHNVNARSSGVPSPMSPSPSPAGSIGSVGSVGSIGGAGAPGNDRHNGSGGNVSNMATNMASPSTTIPVPQRIYGIIQKLMTHSDSLLKCHEVWDRANALAKHAADFFHELDHSCGKLTLDSSILDLVQYARTGLQWIDH